MADKKYFELTPRHIRLLRRIAVTWNPAEGGAPLFELPASLHRRARAQAIMQKPSALARFFLLVSHILISLPRIFFPSLRRQEFVDLMRVALRTGEIAPGTYQLRNLYYIPGFKRWWPSEAIADLMDHPDISFTLTDAHVKLLRAARVGWDGFMDAPGVNVKRPYGDMTYFEWDMADILGLTPDTQPDGTLTAEWEERLGQLHAETLPALMVFLARAAFKTGRFRIS